MSILDEFNAIMQRLDFAIDDSLNTEVANAVREEMHDKVHELVYKPYTPKNPLGRRGDSGGLSSVFNYDARVGNDHLLIVENNTPMQNPDGSNLVEIVEEGKESYKMPFPRPFIKETEESVKAETALMEGLKRNGF